MDLTQANIQNLTSLWKRATEPFETYFEAETYAYAYIPDSQWPNKIWSLQPTVGNSLPEMARVMKTSPTAMSLAFFDRPGHRETGEFIQSGFSLKSIQYGMSLELDRPFDAPSRLLLREVRDEEGIRLWSRTFQEAFGYKIDKTTLERSLDTIVYLNIFYQDEMAGTLILHKTEGVMGIHSLGVIPRMRGKGIAREAMHFALNHAIAAKAKAATLQASEMAKTMYEKLGFTTQFIMRNYQL